MWQHRQQERELKRAEIDLLKQQKQVRQAMRQAETSKLTMLLCLPLPWLPW